VSCASRSLSQLGLLFFRTSLANLVPKLYLTLSHLDF
jgi:hypothetical protein